MTAETEAAAPAQRAQALDRTQLIAFAGLLAALNGCATFLLNDLARNGALLSLINLLGIHPIIWFALYAAARIALEPGPAQPPSAADRTVIGSVLLAAFLPAVSAGSVGVFAAGLWLGLTSPAGGRGRRIGLVLTALSGTLLWGRLFILLLGEPALALDGRFVAWLAGTYAEGNLVYFSGSAEPFVIGTPCSSIHGMTFAILLWASVTQLLRLRMTVGLVLSCVAAMAGLFLVNAVRLATIALDPERFAYWHNGRGAELYGWAGLFVAALIIGGGCHAAARR